MSLIENLQWRYATKKMNGEKVSAEKLETILSAIQLSPSSFGFQPYTVLVIEDAATKEKLLAASYNQSQISDCSHLLVFASWITFDETQVETFIKEISAKRNLPLESLNDFKNYIIGSLSKLTEEQKALWAAKQTYIALGIALAAAAEVKVDSTPMEGFVPAQYDEILGLTDQNLHATLILPLGYRHEGDWLASLPKVRRAKELLFKHI